LDTEMDVDKENLRLNDTLLQLSIRLHC